MSVLTPQQITVRREDDWTLSFNVRPLVARISDKALWQIQQGNIPRIMPQSFDYRLVRREPEWRMGVYARPWALWAMLRAVERWKDVYWNGIRWLEDKGAVHLTSRDGTEFRWRDVRLGRGAER